MASTFGQDKPKLASVKGGAGGSFGQTPPILAMESDPAALEPEEQVEQEKVDPLPVLPTLPKRVIVDETVEKAVTVRHSTVVFRPGQVIIDPFLLAIANKNGVHLIEK